MRNSFRLPEWNAAIADLGTLLPLSFALAAYNGFQPAVLFFLWGIVFILGGWWYKVPVSVQPLKAMAVIAISTGLPAEWLASAGVFYGLLLLALSLGGIVEWLQKWFSTAIVRGIQLGVGLILARKAVELASQRGWFLHSAGGSPLWGLLLMVALALLLARAGRKSKAPLGLLLALGFMLLAVFNGAVAFTLPAADQWPRFIPPDITLLGDLLLLLIIPQLPLTLGNAMYAASDACHQFWPARSARVSPKKLGISIGLFDILIGFFGGFPMCHGSGGIGAYKQFGAKTGGTVIIIGGLLLLSAVLGFSEALFWIPVPLLAALLLLDSLRMMALTLRLHQGYQWLVAGSVGLISLFSGNLTLALLAGLLLERGLFGNRFREKLNHLNWYKLLFRPVGTGGRQL